jgi:putative membrane protein
MLEPFDWATIPAVLLIAYTLFGIEEIGVQIEDPFGMDDNDLPLEDICATIEGNLRMLMPELPVQPSAPAESPRLKEPSNQGTAVPGLLP